MKLLRVFAGYGTASLVQGATGFVSVPLLIGVLGQQGFARWALIEPLIALGAALALLGIHHAHLHDIVTGRMTVAQSMGQFFRLALLPAIAVSTGLGIVVAFVIDSMNFARDIVLASFMFFIEACILLIQFQSRAKSEVVAYASTIWIRSVALLAILFVSRRCGLHFSVSEYLVLISLIGLVALVAISRRRLPDAKLGAAQWRLFSWLDLMGGVKYGMPIVAASLLALVIAMGDRYLVNGFLPADELPGYVVMAKLGGAMAFAMAPVNLWWPVARHRHVNDSDGGSAFFSTALPMLLGYYVLSAAILWVAAGQLIEVYAPGIVGFDPLTLLILVVGGVALAMSIPVNIGTLTPGSTHWSLVALGIAATVGIVSAMVLIPAFGLRGAACATLLAQTTNLCVTYVVSQHLIRVRVHSNALSLMIATGTLLLALLWSVRTTFAMQVPILAAAGILFAVWARGPIRTLGGDK